MDEVQTKRSVIQRKTAEFRWELSNAIDCELGWLKDGDFRAFDDPRGLVTIRKRLFRDVLPELARNSIWNTEKLEGFAVSADERMFIVTDNDGVDDAPGETVFLELRRRGHWRGR